VRGESRGDPDSPLHWGFRDVYITMHTPAPFVQSIAARRQAFFSPGRSMAGIPAKYIELGAVGCSTS